MAFKPNYRFARMERDRLKQAEKDEKLRWQRERKPKRGEAHPTSLDENSPREHPDPLRTGTWPQPTS